MPNCQYCNKEFKNQGGVNLHESVHCKKKPEANSLAKNTKHECSFRLLNPKSSVEKKAIMQGYEEVCDECQEIQ